MIDIQKMLIEAMKGQLFEDKQLNMAARQVLGQMKTKIKDITGQEITSEVQYKMLTKMKKDRENSVKIYSEAVQNSNSENAAINLNKAQNELKPITLFITQLQASMPRVLSYEETKTYIKGFLQLTPNANIGMVMKHLKTRNDIKFDMQIASAIAKQELAK